MKMADAKKVPKILSDIESMKGGVKNISEYVSHISITFWDEMSKKIDFQMIGLNYEDHLAIRNFVVETLKKRITALEKEIESF